ncbi:MAG TPA: hypothetical protein PLK78_17075 [Verrucomicrobiota bacterium]|nr:hypothetical protein [Verrucomicrobiota bacterium]
MNEEIKPLLDLLSGKFGWLSTVLTWLGAITPVTALFATRFKHWASDKLNEIAASSDKDDDAYLRALFSQQWYRFLAFLLRFTPFQLPTLADLERAIALQEEAVQEAAPGTRLRNMSVLLIGFGLAGTLLAGCGAFPVQVADGADPIVVNAEWTAENALNSIDQFLAWERNNEAALLAKDPGIHQAAEHFRANAKQWITDLRTQTKQYKADRQNGPALQAAAKNLLSLANTVDEVVLPQITAQGHWQPAPTSPAESDTSA